MFPELRDELGVSAYSAIEPTEMLLKAKVAGELTDQEAADAFAEVCVYVYPSLCHSLHPDNILPCMALGTSCAR